MWIALAITAALGAAAWVWNRLPDCTAEQRAAWQRMRDEARRW